MKDILTISKWELFKILRRKSAILLIILLTVIMGGIAIKEYNTQLGFRESESAQKSFYDLKVNWREREENVVKYGTEFMGDKGIDEMQKEAARRRVEIAKYKLDHNINRAIYEDMWFFFTDDSFKIVSTIMIIFIAIVGAMSVASEYSEKTIKSYLILPYKRYKLLAAKYLSVFYYAVLLLGVVVICGITFGILIFGMDGSNDLMFLYGKSGPYTISTLRYSILIVLLRIPDIIFYIALSFFFGILTKSVIASTITTITFTTLVSPFIIFASKYYTILNYTPFINMDFRKFLDFGAYMPDIENSFQNVVVRNITSPWTALLILMSYTVVLLVVSFRVFIRRDVH